MKRNSDKTAITHNNEAKYYVITRDKSGTIELQHLYDEIKEIYGIDLEIDPNKSVEENTIIGKRKCSEFWDELENQADIFVKSIESFSESISFADNYNYILDSNPLNSFKKLEVHPYFVLLVADKIKDITVKNTLKHARRKNSSQAGKAKADKYAPILETQRTAIRAEWATGKFKFKTTCVGALWDKLHFASYGEAKKALDGEPNPDPWPARYKN